MTLAFALLIVFSVVLFLLLLGSLVLYVFGIRFFGIIFRRPAPRPHVDRSPKRISQDTIYGRGRNWFYAKRMEFQNLRMRSYDGLRLFAYYRPAQRKKCKKLVILVHGYQDHPSIMGAFAQLYLEKTDCHILIPHLRAHGMSYGNCVGYGLSDSQDILMWADDMKKRLGDTIEIVFHGRSMGAAAVLMAAGSKQIPAGLKGVISDSSFDSLANQLDETFYGSFFYKRRFVRQVVNHLLKTREGYSISKISPVFYASSIEVPVLLFHGKDDAVTPVNMSWSIYDKVPAPKRMVAIDGARHGMCYNDATKRYSMELENFLQICGFLKEEK